MSETGDRGSPSPDGSPPADESGDGGGALNGRQRVIRALGPLWDRIDHARGLSVSYAASRTARGPVVDRSTVEVRFRVPDRHPREVDMARGMLQGRGFDPEKKKRGGSSHVIIYLSVPVDPSEDPDDGESEPWDPAGPVDSGEQSSLDG